QQIVYEQSTLHEHTEQKQRLDIQLTSLREEINELLTQANVHTVEEFYERSSMIEKKQTYEAKRAKLEQQLLLIFQTNDWQSLIDYPLEEQLLTTTKNEYKLALAEHDESLEIKRQALADIKANISQMEQSEDYSTRMHQMQ